MAALPTTIPEIEFLTYRAEVKGDIFRQIHKRLAQLKADGLTQKELAQRLGMNEGQLSKVLKGQRDFRLETLSDLARALGCRIRSKLEPLNPREALASSTRAITLTVKSPEGSTPDAFERASAGTGRSYGIPAHV